MKFPNIDFTSDFSWSAAVSNGNVFVGNDEEIFKISSRELPPPIAVAISPNSKQIAVFDADQTISVYENNFPNSLDLISELHDHKFAELKINCCLLCWSNMHFSPEFKTEDNPKLLKLLELESYTESEKIARENFPRVFDLMRTQSANESTMQYSPNGEFLAYASSRAVHIWSLRDQVRRIEHEFELKNEELEDEKPTSLICFSENNTQLLISRSASITLYSLDIRKIWTQDISILFNGYTAPTRKTDVVSAIASYMAEAFLVGTAKGRVFLASDRGFQLTKINVNAVITGIASHLESILVGTENNELYFFKYKEMTYELVRKEDELDTWLDFNLKSACVSMSLVAGEYLHKFGRDQDAIIRRITHINGGLMVASNQNLIFYPNSKDKFHDYLSEPNSKVITKLDSPIISMDYCAQAASLALGFADKIMILWPDEENTSPIYLAKHSDEVTSLAYTPDGKSLVSGSKDKTIRLWSNSSGYLCFLLGEHDDWITSVTCSPNCQEVASASYDASVKIWSIHSKQLIKSLSYAHAVMDVVYSPDGNAIASAGKGKNISVWFHSRNNTMVLEGHTEEVTSLAYSPDNITLASGGVDKTIKVWNTKQGTLLHTLTDHEFCISCLSYSPDCRELVSVSLDGSMCFWQDNSIIADLTLAQYKQERIKLEETAASLEARFEEASCHDKQQRTSEYIRENIKLEREISTLKEGIARLEKRVNKLEIDSSMSKNSHKYLNMDKHLNIVDIAALVATVMLVILLGTLIALNIAEISGQTKSKNASYLKSKRYFPLLKGELPKRTLEKSSILSQIYLATQIFLQLYA